ncbi:MAG TPA: metal ABC transporter permease [Gemmatimonadota bacterium]|nr:metal ABC transporter permease [Gemmatimonadota bacterium]
MSGALALPFFRHALAAGLLAAVACGVIGSYVVVKEIASISGGLAHAAFGGVGLGYLLGFDPMLGAVGFGLLSGAGIGVAYRRKAQGLETLVSMVWAVGMALGVIFLAMVPGYAPDLASYLFGNILLVSPTWILLAALLDGGVLLALVLWHRPLQALSFDEEFAEVVGVPVTALLLLLLGLTALTVVLLIRVVGVILVIALLTIPAAAARPWSATLGRMMALSTALGAMSIVGGLWLAWGLSVGPGLDLPTGPLIVVVAGVLYGVSKVARSLVRAA